MAKAVVYTTPTCTYCGKVKEFLKEKGVEYEEVNVAASAAAKEKIMELSGRLAVPVTVIGETVISGFDEKKLAEAVK